MPIEIKYNSNSWNAIHSQGRCGGPRSLYVGEQKVFAGLSCVINGISDDMLHSKAAHLYHKAGQAIFESEGHFPGGSTLHETCRYAGNAIRITYDLNWAKGTIPTQPVEIGSCILPGKWAKLTVLDRNMQKSEKNLSGLQELCFSQLPLSLVFEKEDGIKAEYTMGYDLWRWDYALGLKNTTPMRLEIGEEQIKIVNQVADAVEIPEKAPETAVGPEAREYRFMLILAWTWPQMPGIPPRQDCLIPKFKNAQDGIDISKLNQASVIQVNFDELHCVENAKALAVDGSRGLPCLEHSFAVNAFKRIIRQIQSNSRECGHLVLKGMYPKLCLDGRHCDKKGEKLHWDVKSILTLVAWAKNALGNGWIVECPLPDEWQFLPSLSGLHLPNGFNE